MTPEIKNGDYVKNGRVLQEVEHIDALLQDIAILLKAEREGFYPDKNFGSRIFSSKTKDEAYAASLARQAVSGMNGVYIKTAKIKDGNFEFTVIINNVERQVLIKA